jgi:geranylgeranyl pyrophosphate synthase
MKTQHERKLAEEARLLLAKKGAEAYKKAEKIIISEKIQCRVVRDAMHYFMKEWSEVYHPGLLAIACESVGGNPRSTVDIGASLLLLLSNAHIHDDIIDKSRVKGGKLTVYGKFGKDMALLVGDAFLFEGLLHLHQSCDKLPEDKKKMIIELIKTAFFEIGCGEAIEAISRKKHDLLPEKCLEYLNMRAAVAEAIMRIGAIIGNGNEKEIEILGHYGRTLGWLSAIREEFIDVFEQEELKNRYTHEILPLPILYGLRDKPTKEKIIGILQKKKITEEDAYTIAELVIDSEEIRKLKSDMQALIKEEKELLRSIKRNQITLEILLDSTIEDI